MCIYYVPGTLFGRKMYTGEVGDIIQRQIIWSALGGCSLHADIFKLCMAEKTINAK